MLDIYNRVFDKPFYKFVSLLTVKERLIVAGIVVTIGAVEYIIQNTDKDLGGMPQKEVGQYWRITESYSENIRISTIEIWKNKENYEKGEKAIFATTATYDLPVFNK